MLENKIVLTWTRKDFEAIIGKPLTDKEWEVMSSEVETDMEETYLAEVVRKNYAMLDYLMSQDAKYDTCEHAEFRFLDCEEHGADCEEKVCVACGASVGE